MYDVAIIGCGPVGALAANLLGKAGLATLVVEREAAPFPLPRAVHLDHEMLRLFQSAGVIDRILPDMRDTAGHLHIGADHGVIRYMGTVGQPRPFGWSNDYFFYQPELEAHLRRALDRFPNVDLRFGSELRGLTQDADGVTLALGDAADAQSVRARWVIACDGARSAVRKALNVALEDLDFEEPWLVVDAEVDGDVRFPDLTGVPEAADLQHLSVMMCDPRRPATIVPGRGNHRRWEFMLLPGEDDEAMMQPGVVSALVAPWLAGVPHRITRAATYRFHGLIAERWQVGRVFLAGDAAHQTPPFFGQGMCHGLRDVANLSWKLAMVANGVAAPSILDTYQPERDPHVRAVISAAVAAGRYICMLDTDAAAARDKAMREAARAASHSTAADLIPAIGTGIVMGGSAAAGERFIQPWIERDGVPLLLDSATGDGWRLFAIDTATAQAARSRLPTYPVIDASQLGDGGAVAAWLTTRDVRAVLVRPDFYVFGTSDDVGALIESWNAMLGGSPARAEEAA
ncbi:bifunctional 3-(3-hydroxy-phenyl)propionate/3-hydroxycinnamic acid hydroxylase [Sphingomonas sp. BIUV-7]|uniref:Bifunctional 3-(3-hydroxy-phenyl)propionate/3-hydroxycinnamic acid hydroxylase n=1 Tax=Sphingomonas natans TaxID=3063330 RepID=A0ABT8Y761_9SPHN|nr:bifunctional 3-(3-hydroxy-phenyl)propionate/3-hydroxycinnamic acid hydroxylase [Sphingomonas sp. BIUV-7]MDO6414152.1 bifunctional 3-(3-hydroxy-phenyl)propionate/3-hydroxycinnamic acid hydroxylase [Sphingomonas sp. BIUV-7]